MTGTRRARRASVFGLWSVLGVMALAACRKSSPLSTEEIIGEWRRADGKRPPVSLLVTAEGVGLRARVRMPGRESYASARISGRTLRLDFDDKGPDGIGTFVSRTEMDLRIDSAGQSYRLRKRP